MLHAPNIEGDGEVPSPSVFMFSASEPVYKTTVLALMAAHDHFGPLDWPICPCNIRAHPLRALNSHFVPCRYWTGGFHPHPERIIPRIMLFSLEVVIRLHYIYFLG